MRNKCNAKMKQLITTRKGIKTNNMKEFIIITIENENEEQDIYVHYTQLYSIDGNWFWNGKELINYPSRIAEEIEEIIKN